MKTLSAALLLACASAPASADAEIHLSASGDGNARLVLEADRTPGLMSLQASFGATLEVKNSTEAHSRGRSFSGEIRIDGKACSSAQGRIEAHDGIARGQGSTGCSIRVDGDRRVVVEAVVTKAQGLDRDEIKVQLTADKSVR